MLKSPWMAGPSTSPLSRRPLQARLSLLEEAVALVEVSKFPRLGSASMSILPPLRARIDTTAAADQAVSEGHRPLRKRYRYFPKAHWLRMPGILPPHNGAWHFYVRKQYLAVDSSVEYCRCTRRKNSHCPNRMSLQFPKSSKMSSRHIEQRHSWAVQTTYYKTPYSG